MTENLVFKPGTENLYSDLGFILLGKIIEKVSGQSLDDYWQKKIQLPLKLDKGLFFVNKRNMKNVICAATGKCGGQKKSFVEWFMTTIAGLWGEWPVMQVFLAPSGCSFFV